MKDRELRTYAGTIELRAEGAADSRTIVGHAAVFDQLSNNLGWYEEWYEQIDRGAFDDVLSDDVRALFNHDANLVLLESATSAQYPPTASLFTSNFFAQMALTRFPSLPVSAELPCRCFCIVFPCFVRSEYRRPGLLLFSELKVHSFLRLS